MNSGGWTPHALFLTCGQGSHREKLASFELALRDASIECYNLVPVSSILPPRCELLEREAGLEQLQPGQVVPVVLARCQSAGGRAAPPPPPARGGGAGAPP
ncbi:MAG: pyruvoyl-dependent arginine decarboxylase, partial [Candidatus Poseidoniia archaeon]|nr:pyruvoyl-dependent arginine decarboxylase [Candidatus Poseidoniia archaeon]